MNKKPNEAPGVGPACPVPHADSATVQLGHGAGGSLTGKLIDELFVSLFSNAELERRDDFARLDLPPGKPVFSTDSYVVDPVFFPGGNIGDLAVNGTINDLAMSGARPLYLSAGFIIEEGLPIDDLRAVVESMAQASREAGVVIVTGDTKVVPAGKADRLFINTSGVGVIEHGFRIDCSNLQSGDRILLSGPIGDHGIAVMAARERLELELPVKSDTAPLHGLVQAMVAAAGRGVHALRDATRGGVAAVLNELARASRVGIRVEEQTIPVRPPVRGACEVLGLDPLTVANEGVLVASVSAEVAGDALAAMQAHPLGVGAVDIGATSVEESGLVEIRTTLGTWRVLDMPTGVLLPRIC